MQTLTITTPDDWHCHLRDDDYLPRTVQDIAQRFARAIVMPNLPNPIVNVEQALRYRERIQKHIPSDKDFTPLMTFYLTDSLSAQIIKAGKQSGVIHACKLYPAGATTHSDKGVTDIKNIYPVLEMMQQVGLPLLVHGEVTHSDVDIFDREARFIDEVLQPLLKAFPELRVVMEHITTKEAVEFVLAANNHVAATITVHHLLFNRNAILVGGIHPHYYCLPILKREQDREALVRAATSGNAKFFLGTDSAPHAKDKKESSCGCAGIYSAHAAIELYAEVFAEQGALDNFEKFASINGATFYGLPINTTETTLIKQTWQVPETLDYGNDTLIPLRAGQDVAWQLKV